MFFVNVTYSDWPEEKFMFNNENEAAAFMVRCEEFENVTSTKLLRPAKV